MMSLILIVLEYNVFQKKLKYFSVIKTKTNMIQAYDPTMCRYFCIGFIDFMLAEKTLTKFTNLCLPNNFKRNDDRILKHFMTNVLKIGVKEVIKRN